MTHPDWIAGQRSASMGHPEPSPTWATEAFHLGWLDFMVFRTPMTPQQQRRSAEYRQELVRSYRGM